MGDDARDEALADAIVRFLEADEDVPDALVEKVCQRMADLYGAAHMDDARAVLAATLPDATADLRARLQAAEDRLAEVRREVAGEIAAAIEESHVSGISRGSVIRLGALAEAARIAREIGGRLRDAE